MRITNDELYPECSTIWLPSSCSPAHKIANIKATKSLINSGVLAGYYSGICVRYYHQANLKRQFNADGLPSFDICRDPSPAGVPSARRVIQRCHKYLGRRSVDSQMGRVTWWKAHRPLFRVALVILNHVLTTSNRDAPLHFDDEYHGFEASEETDGERDVFPLKDT